MLGGVCRLGQGGMQIHSSLGTAGSSPLHTARVWDFALGLSFPKPSTLKIYAVKPKRAPASRSEPKATTARSAK